MISSADWHDTTQSASIDHLFATFSQNKETRIQMKHQSYSSSTVSWQEIGVGASKTSYAGALVACGHPQIR